MCQPARFAMLVSWMHRVAHLFKGHRWSYILVVGMLGGFVHRQRFDWRQAGVAVKHPCNTFWTHGERIRVCCDALCSSAHKSQSTSPPLPLPCIATHRSCLNISLYCGRLIQHRGDRDKGKPPCSVSRQPRSRFTTGSKHSRSSYLHTQPLTLGSCNVADQCVSSQS